MTDNSGLDAGFAVQTILAYHQRTKHRADGYARGPDTLDWDAQPSPYRHYSGAAITPLPLVSGTIEAPFAAITGQHRIPPASLGLSSIGALMELSFGLSAIKEDGPDQWALRCNPSSGNLHPTEAYVLASAIPGLSDGLHHYRPADHSLEQRCAVRLSSPGLWIGLSSIQWREAWKYGERAFRYCQLDVGHALGAAAAACALLGWQARIVETLGHAQLGAWLGLERAQDFELAEREEGEVMLHIGPAGDSSAPLLPFAQEGARWTGKANLLDPRPMYRWPVIDEAAQASRGAAAGFELGGPSPILPAPARRAADVILQRRSAQRYDRAFRLPQAVSARLLGSLEALLRSTALHCAVFVHRADGLESGAYLLPGKRDALLSLRAALGVERRPGCAPPIPEIPAFELLMADDLRKTIRALACHQAIAADACITICMLADFGDALNLNPARYRQLHWQAGLIGQRLYLEAEAHGISGTGIGCFLDDEVHHLLGLSSAGAQGGRYQAVYHFAVGKALVDPRISALPAYSGRSRREAEL